MGTKLFKASFFKKLRNNDLQCQLCPQNCIIIDGKTGICGVRKNIKGELYSLIYGKTTGIALDPIEKKPLYHFHPGQVILSLGTKGCNLKCSFCQNWHISQNPNIALEDITPEEIIKETQRLNILGIAYTYNEPFIWYEFVCDCAKLAKKNNLENVLVTNGYVNPEPLDEILPFIGAMNIDLKSMDNDFYKKICQGSRDPVLNTIKRANQSCHIELTNLIIPGENDTDEHFEKITDWIFDNTGAETPLHFSRYFPCYKLVTEMTPRATLERALAIAQKKLKLVYLGNI
ncbi:MAG: AmmeMemoRadiSam system radical SAM enzyme [Candidatus Omnitrophota bacterium]